MSPYLWCPTCGSVQEHETLHAQQGTLQRCLLCGVPRREERAAAPTTCRLKVIVSAGESSHLCSLEVSDLESLKCGDHLKVIVGDEETEVEVTGIECGQQRFLSSRCEDISTVWSRVVGIVALKVAVHSGWKTHAETIPTPGARTITVGSFLTVQTRRCRIHALKLRDGALLKREGQWAAAANIKRVYCRPVDRT